MLQVRTSEGTGSKVTRLEVTDESKIEHRVEYVITENGGNITLDCSDFSDDDGTDLVWWKQGGE